MSNISFRTFSAPMVFVALSLTAGIFGGTATVHGLAPIPYGQADAASRQPKAIAATDDETAPGEQASAADCDGCSERDLGYHWASVRQISSGTDCPMESWDFRRGCVAYMRDTGGV
ncbi:hypothetical protein SAMN05444678_101382 [Sphingomonas sp. YR710]|uniref:hypothetical protein n=1 Tax=Sphingomonas sp. YR710 TaxID=1882773 RepID=UPI00088868E3|nr:hypothetical protein [Sphingomonas sp. YR710]SDC11284.1 hypothetical protein SAMN05444678_101382 [Sphingomonas sp. YR710]